MLSVRTVTTSTPQGHAHILTSVHLSVFYFYSDIIGHNREVLSNQKHVQSEVRDYVRMVVDNGNNVCEVTYEDGL
jgi:hypothetical protein